MTILKNGCEGDYRYPKTLAEGRGGGEGNCGGMSLHGPIIMFSIFN